MSPQSGAGQDEKGEVRTVSPPQAISGRLARHLPLSVALAFAFAAFYLPLGIHMPYLSLWLQSRGLGPEEIGVALAVPLIARLFATPVLGFLSDRWGRPRALLITLAAATCLSTTALALSVEPLLIFIVLGLMAMSWNPSFSLLDSYSARQARAGRADYGRSRQWGSGSFLMANLVGGAIITLLGAGSIVLMMLFGHLAYLAALFTLPELERPAPVAHAARSSMKGLWWLVVAVLAIALVQASHALLYAFGSLQWQAQGFSLTTIGVLWAVGVAAEIVLFRFGSRLIASIGALPMVMLGGLAAVVRFGAMAFDPPLLLLLPLQLLHAFTFGATYLGMVELVARGVSEHRSASAQSLASWTVSLMMGGASVVAGVLWVRMGSYAFLTSAGLGGLGILVAGLALLMQRRTFAPE
ncbi:MAG: MFS transporter [Xanthobacter sp.]